MDQKSYASHHHLQHAQNMYATSQLRGVPDGPSLANHLVFRSMFEAGGGVADDKLMQHLQQQQQQQQQYRNEVMMMSNVGGGGGGGHGNSNDQPQNLHKSNPLPPSAGHEQMHTCPEPGCNKTFANKRSLTMHVNTHQNGDSPSGNSNKSPGTGNHQCPDCEKRYRSQCGLYWHEQTIHKKRVFNCPDCSKVYKSYCGFYLHRKSHEGSSYECPHCFKTFTQKGTLKTHLKIHSEGGAAGGGGGVN